MRCDVCYTKIPLGQKRCPHCGYIIPGNKVSSFDADSSTHEHIKTPRMKKIDINQYKNKAKPINKKNTTLITVVIAVVIVLSQVIPIGIATFENIFMSDNISTDYTNYTFEEVIDQGYDEDGTVQMAVDYENQFLLDLEKMGYTEVTVVESTYGSNYGRAYLTVDSEKNDIHYAVRLIFEDQQISEKEITYSGFISSYDRSSLAINQEDVEELANYIQKENVYERLVERHPLMIQDKDDKNAYKYSNYDEEDSIYMTEDISDIREGYYYYYSLG